MGTKFTHTGDLLSGVVFPKKVVGTIRLRKSGKVWVDEKSRKFSIKTGYDVDRAWGLVQLDIKSIKKIKTSE